jgi:hypothetical protein
MRRRVRRKRGGEKVECGQMMLGKGFIGAVTGSSQRQTDSMPW